ncbi:MAG TPA: PrsW family glutamic-type intramembrane protease [Candidatus Paceibacterota bacterium]
MSLHSTEALFLSLIAGIIPAVIWLLFWLREDRARPEPRGLLMLTFIAGMIAVPLVIPFQKITQSQDLNLTFLIWAAIEEIFKFGAAYIVALRREEDNEPIDPLIYMMTVALGFTAMENAIFVFNPLLDGSYTESLITGNIRFIGASLLHTISSATIGIAMGLTFYKSRLRKTVELGGGIIIAIVLHTAFNLFIIKENSGATFATLGFVWIAIVILMLFFERLKRVHPVK